MANKKKKNKNKTKHFFYHSYISIILFILYFILNVIMYESFNAETLIIIFIMALLSYCSALVLPEHVDIECNSEGSKIIMWVMRIMFVLGLLYSLNDVYQPCSFMCFNGIKALLSQVGLIVIPFIVEIIYGIVYCFIKKND